MKDTLLKLLNAYGATGREDTVAGVIREMVAPLCDEIAQDALGNLIARKRGAGRRIMVAAHMDHIGFIVADIDENGFLRVSNVGGIHKVVSLNRHVTFENGVEGVLSYEQENFDANDRAMTGLFIDIGARSREEAEAAVSIGDVAVYAPDAIHLMGNRIAAPALDDRAGCAVAIAALRALGDCPNEVAFVFTTQEEVGLRGATAAAYGIDPAIGIALDVTPSGDTPKGLKYPMALGKGVCVKIMDGYSISSPKIVRRLEALALESDIPCQREVLFAGGTDAGAMQQTRAGVPVATLSVPCRYVHSACEMVDLADLESAASLLEKFLSNPV